MATQRKLDSLLNLVSTKTERAEMVCDTVIKKETDLNSKQTEIFVGGARTISSRDQPLIIVDGRMTKQKHLKKIDPNTIKEISVLKYPEAEAIYGSKGKNGVLVITTNTAKMNRKEMQ